MFKLNNRGFTLIEILAAMILLIIFFSIGVVGVGSAIRNSNKSAYVNNSNVFKNNIMKIDSQDDLGLDDEDAVFIIDPIIFFDSNEFNYKEFYEKKLNEPKYQGIDFCSISGGGSSSAESGTGNVGNEKVNKALELYDELYQNFESPFGSYKVNYVLVTFDGNNYHYFYVAVDDDGWGIRLNKEIQDLNKDDVENLEDNYNFDAFNFITFGSKENSSCSALKNLLVNCPNPSNPFKGKSKIVYMDSFGCNNTYNFSDC